MLGGWPGAFTGLLTCSFSLALQHRSNLCHSKKICYHISIMWVAEESMVEITNKSTNAEILIADKLYYVYRSVYSTEL